MTKNTADNIPRIVLVVPLRAEFANGNLAGFLLSLARQRTALDVILIINNSELDRAFATPAWEDNRAALAWLAPLANKGQASEVKCPSLFSTAATRIKDSSLTIHVLDLTEGQPRKMGLLRQRGIEYAAHLTQTTAPHNVILLSADADCRYGPRLMHNLKESFANSSLRMAVLPLLYIPFTFDPALLATYACQHIPLLLDQALRQFTGAPRARLGAPQLAARLDLLLEAGGYAMLDEGEDFELGQRLIRMTSPKIMHSASAIVWTADRAVAAGFESGARLAGLRDRCLDSGQTAQACGETDNPLAVFLATHRKDPGLQSKLERIFGHETSDWLVNASEHSFWSEIETQRIPRRSADPRLLLEALRIIEELAPLPQMQAARMRRNLNRYLELIERTLGCPAHALKNIWPDAVCRELWLEAATLMLLVPDQVENS